MRKKETEDLHRLVSMKNGLCMHTKQLAAQFPFYAEKLSVFEAKLEKLRQLQLKIFQEVNETTAAKNQAKEKAIQSVLMIANGVKLHALSEGKRSLYKASCYVYSDFNRPEPAMVLGRMEQILNSAKSIHDLKKFALTKEMLKETEEKVNNYRKNMYRPLLHVKQKAQWAKECRKLMNDCKKFIKTHFIPFFELLKNDPEHATASLGFLMGLKMKKRGRPKGSLTVNRKKATPPLPVQETTPAVEVLTPLYQ